MEFLRRHKETSSSRPVYLVALDESEESMQALELACEAAVNTNAIIKPFFVEVVPRNLDIEIPLPEQEDEEKRVFMQAQELMKKHGIRLLEDDFIKDRSRTPGKAIVDKAKDLKADTIFVGAEMRDYQTGHPEIEITSDYILNKAPCRVILRAFPIGTLRRNNKFLSS